MKQSFTDQTQRGAMAERPSEIVQVPWFAQEICLASEESVMYTAYNRPNTQYLEYLEYRPHTNDMALHVHCGQQVCSGLLYLLWAKHTKRTFPCENEVCIRVLV